MYQRGYRTVRKWHGKKIIIDLANVPFPLGNGPEVMVMYASNGAEIESARPADLNEAVVVYRQMLGKYPEDAKEAGRR